MANLSECPFWAFALEFGGGSSDSYPEHLRNFHLSTAFHRKYSVEMFDDRYTHFTLSLIGEAKRPKWVVRASQLFQRDKQAYESYVARKTRRDLRRIRKVDEALFKAKACRRVQPKNSRVLEHLNQQLVLLKAFRKELRRQDYLAKLVLLELSGKDEVHIKQE